MGWLEKWGLKLISTQVVVEVEVEAELGKKKRVRETVTRRWSSGYKALIGERVHILVNWNGKHVVVFCTQVCKQ